MTARPAKRAFSFPAFCLAAGAAAVLAVPGSASAGKSTPEVATPRVVTPHVPLPGAKRGIAGCWAAKRTIYGPYAFSFCSNGQYGGYKIRGGGLACDGSVTVKRGPGNAATIRLSRSACNGWTDWSADYLVCKTAPGRWMPHGSQSLSAAEVAVPRPHRPGRAGRLDCTYFPVVNGYHPVHLTLIAN